MTAFAHVRPTGRGPIVGVDRHSGTNVAIIMHVYFPSLDFHPPSSPNRPQKGMKQVEIGSLCLLQKILRYPSQYCATIGTFLDQPRYT